MASTYPGGLDAFATTRADATTMATTHKDDHNNYADAINKIEAELGTNPSAAYSDVTARFAAIGAGSGTVLGWLNVVADYGADPTGSADATSAFASAVSAVNANGGTIYVPRGKYKIIGSGGVGVDISGKNVRFVGETVRSINDSAPGLGSYIYTPTSNLVLFNHTNSSQFQAGPVFENITFGETVTGNTGVTLLKLDDVNHHYVRNCSFRGSDGNSSTIGIRCTGTIDASYGLVDFCFFRNCFTAYKTDSAQISQARVFNCYFVCGAPAGTPQASHVMVDIASGVQTFVGCKFEGNDNTSGIAVKVNGAILQMMGCHFEGCTTGVDFPNPGSQTNDASTIIGNSFLGSNGSETGINIHGANTLNVTVGPNRYSNNSVNVADSGTDTILWDRPDAVGRFVSFGGPGIYTSSGAPGMTAPDGSLCLRKTGGASAGLYVRVNGSWVPK